MTEQLTHTHPKYFFSRMSWPPNYLTRFLSRVGLSPGIWVGLWLLHPREDSRVMQQPLGLLNVGSWSPDPHVRGWLPQGSQAQGPSWCSHHHSTLPDLPGKVHLGARLPGVSPLSLPAFPDMTAGKLRQGQLSPWGPFWTVDPQSLLACEGGDQKPLDSRTVCNTAVIMEREQGVRACKHKTRHASAASRRKHCQPPRPGVTDVANDTRGIKTTQIKIPWARAQWQLLLVSSLGELCERKRALVMCGM